MDSGTRATDLEELEARLRGSPTEPTSVKSIVKGFFAENRTVIAMVYPSDFAYVINQAIRA